MATATPSIKVGDPVPVFSWSLTQQNMNLWAEVSTDFNPLHTDPVYAKTTPFGSTIAAGPMALAFICRAMSGWLGGGWTTHGSLQAVFLKPVHPGDTVTLSGEVTQVREEGGCRIVECRLICRNQRGEDIIGATATGALT